MDKDNSAKLVQQAQEAVDYSDLRLASESSAQIKKILAEGTLEASQKDVFDDLLVMLKYVRILAISDAEFYDLIQNHLLASYIIPDFDTVEAIGNRFTLYDFLDDKAEFLKAILEALQKNQEEIGKGLIVLNNTELSPTISNWIKMYDLSPSKSALRNQLDAVSFLNKLNPKIKLTETDKQMLLETLKIYNGTKNWIAEYDSLPVAGDNEEFTQEDLLKMMEGEPREVAKTLNLPKANSIDGVSITKPLNAANVPTQPLPVASASLPKIQETGEQENTMQKTLQEIERAKPNPEVVGRLDELLKKAKPVQVEPIKSEVNSQAQNPQIDIDAKLEELKKRVGK